MNPPINLDDQLNLRTIEINYEVINGPLSQPTETEQPLLGQNLIPNFFFPGSHILSELPGSAGQLLLVRQAKDPLLIVDHCLSITLASVKSPLPPACRHPLRCDPRNPFGDFVAFTPTSEGRSCEVLLTEVGAIPAKPGLTEPEFCGTPRRVGRSHNHYVTCW